MQRYFIDLSYNGSKFHGWQIQPNAITVQEVIEKCLSKIHSNSEVKVVGCGRTDTGVHANHFVLHVDLEKNNDLAKFVFTLNRMLPASISIQAILPVSSDMHARFSATSRTYRYFIHQEKDSFIHDKSWHLSNELDFLAMNSAAKFLVGKQDFTSLSKLHTDVKTNICTITSAQWVHQTTSEAYFEITADRFLRNMVRATVGTLIDVGLGKLEPKELKSILEAKDRQAASFSVPAHGLFLWRVDY